MVKNLPSSAGDAGSISGRGTKIPHAVGQLSPHAATTEHTGHSWREARELPRGARTPQQGILHAATKIPHAATKTQRSPKK